jgi:hypothetical protein
MSATRHLPIPRKLAKLAFAALALVALSFMLARPICDAFDAAKERTAPPPVAGMANEADQHDDSGSCCHALDGGTLAVAAGVLTSTGKSPALIPASADALSTSYPSSPSAKAPPRLPPILARYYARTARILI